MADAVRKENRLASEADFRRVRSDGRSLSSGLMSVHVRRSGLDRFRVGISVGKRVGGAVQRNTVRRRIRELVRLRVKGIRSGWDVVIVARPPALRATYGQLGEAIDQLFGRARLLEPSGRPRPDETTVLPDGSH